MNNSEMDKAIEAMARPVNDAGEYGGDLFIRFIASVVNANRNPRGFWLNCRKVLDDRFMDGTWP